MKVLFVPACETPTPALAVRRLCRVLFAINGFPNDSWFGGFPTAAPPSLAHRGSPLLDSCSLDPLAVSLTVLGFRLRNPVVRAPRPGAFAFH